ncbi:uncharacterized protein [Pocillopora verrucosa]|uniref:uncharacterized protein isoform X2 n=1 Tax=Pocillopora verrucosa TaxID=203993 RepID=UPI003342046E
MKCLSVEADIGTIVQRGNVGLWLPLENVKSDKINLRCTWFTLTAKPEDLPLATNTACGTTSAFCKLTVGIITYQSKVDSVLVEG